MRIAVFPPHAQQAIPDTLDADDSRWHILARGVKTLKVNNPSAVSWCAKFVADRICGSSPDVLGGIVGGGWTGEERRELPKDVTQARLKQDVNPVSDQRASGRDRSTN